MKYRWVKQKNEDILGIVGKKPIKITRGNLETESEDVTESGIEIEFAEELTASELALLDRQFQGYGRESGKTLGDEVAELKAKVEKLESLSIK